MYSNGILKLILKSGPSTFFSLTTGIIVLFGSSTEVYGQNTKLKRNMNVSIPDNIRKDSSKVSTLYGKDINEVIITS